MSLDAPHAAGALELLGETAAEAFVERALRFPREVAVVDDLSGVLTYERLLVGALLLARRLRRFDGAHIGVMLPASAGCDLAILGTLLAGKVPALLNWTAGPAGVTHACELLSLEQVISSERFLDKAGARVPEGVEVFALESLREASALEKLGQLLRVRWRKRSVRRGVPAVSPGETLAVLFTSGSERAPKAVPLTHTNVLSCLRDSITALTVRREDVLLGFLPPFHSFGLTVGTMLPLLGGMRVVHHANPTEAKRLAAKTAEYGATIVCATPTFLRILLKRAKSEQLASVRVAAVGAEACPAAVFELFDERVPGGVIVEGYGITECSPVVAVNPPAAPRRGSVGLAIDSVELAVVDPDDPATARDEGQMGLLLVRGPTVFPGYLGDAPDPFVEHAGRRWYSTGDLVRIDADGYVFICGRIKRFLKAAGEMISLPALEAHLAEAWPADDDGPRLAVEGVECGTGACRIVCFTTDPELTLEAANEALAAAGLPRLMRIDAVEQLDAIPQLGSGKTDYKQLRALVSR